MKGKNPVAILSHIALVIDTPETRFNRRPYHDSAYSAADGSGIDDHRHLDALRSVIMLYVHKKQLDMFTRFAN
jgi:hypothetical protein